MVNLTWAELGTSQRRFSSVRFVPVVFLFFALLHESTWAQDVDTLGPAPSVIAIGRTAKLHLSAPGPLAVLELPPTVDDLAIKIAPAKESIAGKLYFTVELSSFRPGEYEIPPFHVLDGTRRLSSPARYVRVVEDPVAAANLEVFLTCPSAAAFTGELVDITLEIRLNRTFRTENLLQISRRELSLPIRVHVPWIESLLPPSEEVPQLEIAFNDKPTPVEWRESKAKDGQVQDIMTIRTRQLVPRDGLRLRGAQVTFAYATHFEENFLNGRTALDRQDAGLASEDLVLEALPLPALNQPVDFSGAIGQFFLSAQVGESSTISLDRVPVLLQVRGHGNPGDLRPPQSADAIIKIREHKTRKVGNGVDHLFTISGLKSDGIIPPFRFSFFDPEDRVYVTRTTKPIFLDQTKLFRTATSPFRGPLREFSRGEADEPLGIRTITFVFAFLVAAPLALAWISLQIIRAREFAARHPEVVRSRRALRQFKRRLRRSPQQVHESLAAYFADKTAMAPSIVHSPEFLAQLLKSGLDAESAAGALRLFSEVVNPRFGDSSTPPTGQVVLERVCQLDRRFGEML